MLRAPPNGCSLGLLAATCAASWLLPTLLTSPTFVCSYRNFCGLLTQEPSKQEDAGFYVYFLGRLPAPPGTPPTRVLQWASGHGVKSGPAALCEAIPYLCEGSRGVLLTCTWVQGELVYSDFLLRLETRVVSCFLWSFLREWNS